MKIDPNISSYFSNPKNEQQNHTQKANPKINKKNKGKIWGNWTTIIPVGVNLLETHKANPFAVNLLQFLILDSWTSRGEEAIQKRHDLGFLTEDLVQIYMIRMNENEKNVWTRAEECADVYNGVHVFIE
jgi:hypothetical protein